MIRDAQLQKIPYMLVVGDKEIEADSVSLRLRTGEDRGMMRFADFRDYVQKVVAGKTLI